MNKIRGSTPEGSPSDARGQSKPVKGQVYPAVSAGCKKDRAGFRVLLTGLARRLDLQRKTAGGSGIFKLGGRAA